MGPFGRYSGSKSKQTGMETGSAGVAVMIAVNGSFFSVLFRLFVLRSSDGS